MTDFGISTIDNLSKINFYSPQMSSNYFDTSINASNTTSFGDPSFSLAGNISTPFNPSSWFVDFSNYTYKFTVPGGVNTGGDQYLGPALYVIQGPSNFVRVIVQSKIQCNVARFGKLSNTSNGYGMQCLATDGYLAISQNYKTYYLHPDSSLNKIRSSVANNNATALSGPLGSAATSYNQSFTQNITFDTPFDNPPFIFITESSGPIAFNGMIMDSNNKFVGASICAAPGFDRWPLAGYPPYPYAAITPKSFTFSYFIVSADIPANSSASSYGMEVYDSSSNVTFSSKYFIPSINKLTVSMPYLQLVAQSSGGLNNFVRQNSHTLQKTATQGVCINSFQAITGLTCEGDILFGSAYFGAMTLAGRYITVSPTSYTITGEPTSSIYVYAAAIYGAPSTYDFVYGQTSNIDVFLANYEY